MEYEGLGFEENEVHSARAGSPCPCNETMQGTTAIQRVERLCCSRCRAARRVPERGVDFVHGLVHLFREHQLCHQHCHDLYPILS